MKIDRMIVGTVGIGAFLAIGSLAGEDGSSGGKNLLRNPGFEDGTNWLSGWTIENTQSNGAPYYYALDWNGGGHGEAPPRSGRRAIEIYSSDRITRLFQKVTLPAGAYRLSAFAQNQGGGGGGEQLRFGLGARQQSVPVTAMDYRRYYADFDVPTGGAYEVAFVSQSCGMALDDLCLQRQADAAAESFPYLLFNLSPSSRQRSQGCQPYVVGQRQWVDFTIACIDARRLHSPSLRIYCPKSVKLSGFNDHLLKVWAMPGTTNTTVNVDEVVRDGVAYRRHAFPLPRFVSGPQQPMTFGGFWVEIPSGGIARLLIEFEDQGVILPPQEVVLIPVSAPERQVTPRKILTVAYDVQNWMQDLDCRLAALPSQFAMMGFNVWSDYGLYSLKAHGDKTSAEEQVCARAFNDGAAKEFWPNTSSLLETDFGGGHHELPGEAPEKDMYVVEADGKTNSIIYNMRYIAQGGKAWRGSLLAAFQYTLRRPRELKLPYSYSGFISDGFEALIVSYDPTTLDEFAQTRKLDRKDVTPANLNGKLKPQWLAYNMELYTRASRLWADAMRQVDPKVKTIITASAFGPIGADSLPLREQMEWAKGFDYTMPQWYGQHYYGDGYYQEIKRGVAEKVYGKANGYADVIPMMNLSMGAGLQDPNDLRFKMFDLLSTAPAVKGIAYYIATYGFADGQFMVGLSRNHTLLADVEDYYVDGDRADGGARFVADKEPEPIRGLDINGQTAVFKPTIATSMRVHTLNRDGRIALLTVISHCNQGLGEKGLITFDPAFLKKFIRHPTKAVIIDRLTGTVTPFNDRIQVDTTKTGNMALLEIAAKK